MRKKASFKQSCMNALLSIVLAAGLAPVCAFADDAEDLSPASIVEPTYSAIEGAWEARPALGLSLGACLPTITTSGLQAQDFQWYRVVDAAWEPVTQEASFELATYKLVCRVTCDASNPSSTLDFAASLTVDGAKWANLYGVADYDNSYQWHWYESPEIAVIPVARGDVNASGEINIIDAQIIYDLAIGNYGVQYEQYTLPEGWTLEILAQVADANGDGCVDAADALLVQSYVHGNAQIFAPGFKPADDPSGDIPPSGDDPEEIGRPVIIPDGVYTIHSALNDAQVLDIAGGSTASGANVQLYAGNGSAAQRYVFSYDAASGFYSVTNVKSGLALDVQGAYARNGANVQQYEANGTPAQQWRVLATSDGYYTLESALGTRLVLEAQGGNAHNGANIQIYEANGTPAQKFALRPAVEAETVAPGTYVIASALGFGAALDASDASAKLTVARASGSQAIDAQAFTFTRDAATGYYTIANAKTGKVLAPAGGSVADGTSIVLATPDGSITQQWVVDIDAAGQITIANAVYPLAVLSATVSQEGTGAIAIGAAANGDASAQRFLLLSASAPDPVAPSEELPEGWFNLACASDPSYVAEAAGGSREAGANIQLYTANGTFAQLFRFELMGDYYRIICGKSSKVLAVNSNGWAPGLNVQQVDPMVGDALQLWSARQTDGGWSFINVSSGLALQIAGQTPQLKTNVEVGAPSTSSSQTFVLQSRTQILPDGVYELRGYAGQGATLGIEGDSVTADVGLVADEYAQRASQKWVIAYDAQTATYMLQNVNSALFLHVAGQVAVQAEYDPDDETFGWTLANLDEGYFQLVNSATGQALEIHDSLFTGTAVSLEDPDGSSGQRFTVIARSPVEEGEYVIRSASDPNQVLDAEDAGLWNGTNIQSHSENGNCAQRWALHLDGDNYATIVGVTSLRCLDVDSGRAEVGRNIELYDSNKTPAQKWKIVPEGDGTFSLRSALDYSLCLEIAGDAAVNFANVQLGEYTGAATQRFTFDTFTWDVLSKGELISILNHDVSSYSFSTFNTGYSLNSASGRRLRETIDAIASRDIMGFVLIDITTGAGVSYGACETIWGASTVKGPYAASICRSMPDSVTPSVRDIMWCACSWSSNDDYRTLRGMYGSYPMSAWQEYTDAYGFSPSITWPNYTAQILAKMWVGMYDYWYVHPNYLADWNRSCFTHTTLSFIDWTLGDTYKLYSKPGWNNEDGYYYLSRNDAGIVFAGDHPYIVAIMSKVYDEPALMDLTAALDWVHQDMVNY